MTEIRETTHVSDREEEILDRIDRAYAKLISQREEAVKSYEAGQIERGAAHRPGEPAL